MGAKERGPSGRGAITAQLDHSKRCDNPDWRQVHQSPDWSVACRETMSQFIFQAQLRDSEPGHRSRTLSVNRAVV